MNKTKAVSLKGKINSLQDWSREKKEMQINKIYDKKRRLDMTILNKIL